MASTKSVKKKQKVTESACAKPTSQLPTGSALSKTPSCAKNSAEKKSEDKKPDAAAAANGVRKGPKEGKKEGEKTIKEKKPEEEGETTELKTNSFTLPPKLKNSEIAKLASEKLFKDYEYDKDTCDIKVNTAIRAKHGIYKLVHRISHHLFKAEDEMCKKNFMIKFFGEEDQQKCFNEKDVCEKIAELKSSHFLKLVDYGQRGTSSFLVLSQIDSTIHEKFPFGDTKRDCSKFKNFTKVLLAKQMLKCLECLHSIGFVHGNLSFDNFGIVDNNTVVLLNFEFAKKSGEIPSTTVNAETLKNIRYVSRSYHTGAPLKFKDDVESLLFVLVEFFKELPWMNEPPNVMEFVKDEALCKKSDFMQSLPFAMRFMFNSIMKQSYDMPINYQMLQSNLDNLFTAKDMIPILEWNKAFIYLGKLAPPHLSIPCFIKDHHDLAIVFKCDLFRAEKNGNAFYSEKNCGCFILFNGNLSTYRHCSLAPEKMMIKKFLCEFHKKEINYIHTCSRTADHPFFEFKEAESEEKEVKDIIVNADDYPKELIEKMDKLGCQTARSEFVESDFPDCQTANLFTEYD